MEALRCKRQTHAGRVGAAVFAALSAMIIAMGALVGLAEAGGKKGKGDIKRVSRSNKGATNLARAIFENHNKRLVRAKFVATPAGNGPVAISRKSLSGFPRRGGAFAILSTGCARLADNPNKNGRTGCRDGGVRVRGARDVTIWRIRIRVPKQANCLSFRFKFLSEEFPEFVDFGFNDAFIAEVRRPGQAPRWTASDRRDPAIRAPGNFATTRDGNLISINATRNARVTRGAARGTTYDAATGKLRASTRVRSGPQLLYLSIFDQGDRQYDSAVFVDRLVVRKAKKCRSGVVGSK